ncbi:MAG TPA: GNAT family N-acetyltransferase, partial [Candidatus Binatia bacterium]|nr:GNAT family N-acetyltransferase [Candidatus Binatia bacterium]
MNERAITADRIARVEPGKARSLKWLRKIPTPRCDAYGGFPNDFGRAEFPSRRCEKGLTVVTMAVTLKKFSADRLDDCVSLLAEAFVQNPLHRSAFGDNRLDQNRAFFRIGLRHMFIGSSFVALDARDGVPCGYVHFNAWPNCLPAPEELPYAVATQLQPLGEAIPQVIRWFGRWCHLDPAKPHVHLGPIGVAPERQRQGVGTALMRCYI